MTEENQTFARNEDGTISITVEGRPIRYAKESDLLTVKGASETARREYETNLAKYQADLANANRITGETHQTLLQERAAKEQFEKDSKELPSLRTRLGELETESAGHKTARGKAEEELTGLLRAQFGTKYHVDPEKIATMTLDQLREAERNFVTVGFTPVIAPANYDKNGGGGGTGDVKKTGIEQAGQELAIARQQQAKRRAGIADPDLQQ